MIIPITKYAPQWRLYTRDFHFWKRWVNKG